MSFEAVSDHEFYAPAAPLDGVGADIAPQLYATALGSRSWSVSEFNYYMQLMYYRILSWDQAGWYYPTAGMRACWRTHPAEYARWRSFMARFQAFFRKGFSYYYVSSADEKTARGLLTELRRWGSWFDTQCAPASRTRSGSTMNGFGDLGVIPIIFYVAGAAAVSAGAAVAAWLSKDEWSVGEYNNYMSQMHATILAWDKLGWSTKCWEKNPVRREMWNSFMHQFQQHYARGKIADHSYVSDSDEKPARDLMTRLALWGEWLQNYCGADTGPRVEPPDAPKGFNLESTLKWGALLTLGVVGLNVIRGVKDALPGR